MSADNVWLQGRHQEMTSLQHILLAIDLTPSSQAVRGGGVPDRQQAAYD